MSQKAVVNAKTRDSVPKNAVVVLGNSSKEQLKQEAKQWIKDAQRDSKNLSSMFTF